MSYSKIVSGMPGFQTLWKRSTALGSQVGPNAQMIYTGDRVQAPAGSTFYAPLNADTVDHKGYAPDTFTRASDGLYQNQAGEWQTAADNVARFENRMLLMEPDSTNVFWNSDAPVTQTRTLNATGEWTISVHGAGSVVSSDGTGTATGHGTATDGNDVTINVTLAGTFTFTVSGSLDYVQVENLPVSTSPIVTQGASASRAVDQLQWTAGFVDQAQGTVLIRYAPLFEVDGVSAVPGVGTFNGMVSLSTASARNLLYWRNAAAKSFRSYDGVNVANPGNETWVKGDSFSLAVRWTGAIFQIGYSKNGGSWVWSIETTYDGAFDSDDIAVYLNEVNWMPGKYSEFIVYGEALDVSQIETDFS